MKEKFDILDDCFLSIINFRHPEKHLIDDKGILEFLENELNSKETVSWILRWWF